MKQIINNSPTVIELNQFKASVDKYYGFTFKDSTIRWFATSLAYNTEPKSFGIYGLMNIHTLTTGSLAIHKCPLQELIESHVKAGARVFEFDSFVELMSWVCEKDKK